MSGMAPLERQDLASSSWEGSASRHFSACGVLTTLPAEPRTQKVLAHGLSVQKLGPSWAKRMSWSPCCGPLLGEPGLGSNIAPRDEPLEGPEGLANECHHLALRPLPEISPDPPSNQTSQYGYLPRILSH